MEQQGGPGTFAFDESHALYGPIRAMVEDQLREARTAPSLRVHPDDEMFRHSLAALPTLEFGTMAYFRAGLQILDALRQTAGWHHRSLASLDRVLDFAAGYGRSSRFLAALLPPERVWTAEILPDAVAFQRAEFGVTSIQSSTDPAEFRCDEQFDLIFVSSLFSHLPERTWVAWLERLHRLLAPSGILAFSVHGEDLVPPSHRLPDGGLLFLPENEADSWEVSEYGTTFVSEGFVSRVVEQRLPCDGFVRLPKSLCFSQDLYIVGTSGHLAEDRRFWRGPYGQVAEVDLVDVRKRSYRATGWAIDMDGTPSPDVLIKVGRKKFAKAPSTLDRPDSIKKFQVPEGLHAKGWTATFRLPAKAVRPTHALTVAARSSTSDKEFVLDLVPLVDRLSPPATPKQRGPVHLMRTARRVQRKSGWAKTARLAREHWSKPAARR
jgi:SAM-dependent methyltransferase